MEREEHLQFEKFDNDCWLRCKMNTVYNFNYSSLIVECLEKYSGIRQELSYEELISKNIFEQIEAVFSVVCIIHQTLSSQGEIYAY